MRVLLVIFLALPVILKPQLTTGILEGTVHNVDGQPASELTLFVAGRAGFQTVIHTDSEGHFTVSLPYGRYTVSSNSQPLKGSVLAVLVKPLRTVSLNLVIDRYGSFYRSPHETISLLDRAPGLGLWSKHMGWATFSQGFSLQSVVSSEEPGSVAVPLDFTGLGDNRLALMAGQMKEFERQFYIAVDEFLTEYPAYIEQMRPALNGLFRPEDYPDAHRIRGKLELCLEILPIPNGEDFRVALSDEQRTRISRKIDAQVRASLEKGTRELWMRLRKLVDHMVARLQQPDGRLYASVVDNVVDLIDVMPDLNLTNDPALNVFADEIRTRLCAASAKELKSNDLLRSTTVEDAADIASRMAAHMEYGETSRQAGAAPNQPPPQVPSQEIAEDICSQMSAYMIAQ